MAPTPADAALLEPLTVLTFEHIENDRDLSVAFRRLLELELRKSVSVVPSPESVCGSADCAREAGVEIGARTVVYGSLIRLGSKLRVAAFASDVQTGKTSGVADLAIGSEEELDTAATRIAPVLIGDRANTTQTAELGTLTSKETDPDLRRGGDHGVVVRLGGVVPTNNGYSGANAGAEVGLSYAFETRNFLIEPRVAVRWNLNPSGADEFWEVPIEIGGYYIFGRGDVAPFAGGGVGIRYLSDRRERETVIGQTIQTRSIDPQQDDAWAFGGFLRGGIMVLRTYDVRLSLSLEYNISFVDLNGVTNPQALTAGVGVHF